MSEAVAMDHAAPDSLPRAIERDIWAWIDGFVTVPNEFYHDKFPPCPYARRAVLARTVDVAVWQSGDARPFIRQGALGMRDNPALTTRVMAFPPRTQWDWGINDYVEVLNAELIPNNVFLNTGIAKTSISRYPGSARRPYFIVVANSLAAVLSGSQSLQLTDYYKDWPRSHYEIVVERRARLARRYRGSRL
jgi:hypothetical protein